MFINIRPKLIKKIPWGWENRIAESTGTPVVVKHPGKVTMPNLCDYYDWDCMEASLPLYPEELRGCGTRDNKSILTTAVRFMGWEGIATEDPDEIFPDIIEQFVEWNDMLLDRCRGALDCFMIGDDYGFNGGLMISPEYWYTHIYPGLQRLVGVARFYGCKVAFHSDGDIHKILDILLSLNIDVLDYEPVGRMAAYNGRHTLYGTELVTNHGENNKYLGYKETK